MPPTRASSAIIRDGNNRHHLSISPDEISFIQFVETVKSYFQNAKLV
jgi:hypothetical protein